MNNKPQRKVLSPLHKICSKNVSAPILTRDDEMKICVQWFGKIDRRIGVLPKKCQLLFPLFIRDESVITTLGNIEDFKTIFIGQAKNWINGNSTEAIINSIGQGDPEAWLIWTMNSRVLGEPDHPLSPLVQLELLADPNCEIITPQAYYRPEVPDEILASF
jgi:hypothetical protein